MKRFVSNFNQYLTEQEESDENWGAHESDLQEEAKKLPSYQELIEIGAVDVTTRLVKNNESFRFILPFNQYTIKKDGSASAQSLSKAGSSQMHTVGALNFLINSVEINRYHGASAGASSSSRKLSTPDIRGYTAGFIACINHIKESLVDAAKQGSAPKSLVKRREMFKGTIDSDVTPYLIIARGYSEYINYLLQDPHRIMTNMQMGQETKTNFLREISRRNPGESMKRYFLKTGLGDTEYIDLIDLI